MDKKALEEISIALGLDDLVRVSEIVHLTETLRNIQDGLVSKKLAAQTYQRLVRVVGDNPNGFTQTFVLDLWFTAMANCTAHTPQSHLPHVAFTVPQPRRQYNRRSKPVADAPPPGTA